jgi:hypothetical protein
MGKQARALFGTGLLAATFFAGAVAAQAASTRYASPAGPDNGACQVTGRCSLEWAVEQAVAGDTVRVAPGNYTDADVIQNTAAVNVIGEAGGSPPQLTSSAPTFALATGGLVRNLRVTATANSAIAINAAEGLDHVVGVATGTSGRACAAGGFSVAAEVQILDSDCLALPLAGTGVYALPTGSGPVVIRNVTAIGQALGIYVSAFPPTSVSVVNSIASGAKDIVSESFMAAPFTFTSSHSNYDTNDSASLVSDGTDQVAPPAFVNLGAGDVHQAPGSPTRNAGTNAGVASDETDLDGNPRILEATADIGAHEFVGPPVATTLPAAGVGPTGATLNGVASSAGLPGGTAYFEYGSTTAYGSATPAQAPPPASAAISAQIGGLHDGSSFHFRLVVSTAGGTVLGGDQSFATPDQAPPLITDVALTAHKFRTTKTLTATAAAARRLAKGASGTTLLYSLSEPAAVQIAVEKLTKGRLSKGKCKTSKKTGKRCTKVTPQGRLDRTGIPGSNKLSFSGRFGTPQLSRKLVPGNYRFAITATDRFGNRSKVAFQTFTVLKS